ncbi:hypothetical protein [Paraburkholderia lycopersici]|uniref:Uncharacterized protein n=1 Tax=Paraburkholderia lycopersici TaxID=416944 RepID=A0A1G6LVZ1_9BURK|nr:hypothetical protein [Paraburkholderia lycopersici]SDC47391.1 hypothetical protein SAMN05421548_10757 [Paraburkholderia lycopersici]
MFTAMLSVTGRYEEDGFVAIPLKDDVLSRHEFQIQTMSGRLVPTLVKDFCEHVKVEKDLAIRPGKRRRKPSISAS